MRDFIKKTLTTAKKTKIVEGTYSRGEGNVVDIKGTVIKNLASFEIVRTKGDHKCSGISVQDMPLTDKAIENIAELAVENL